MLSQQKPTESQPLPGTHSEHPPGSWRGHHSLRMRVIYHNMVIITDAQLCVCVCVCVCACVRERVWSDPSKYCAVPCPPCYTLN